MAQRTDHDALITRGLTLHEARRYAAALPLFDGALAVAPGCPLAEYNRANTLHMLCRDAEAEPLLRGLLTAGPEGLRGRCPCIRRTRPLYVDAHLLLFWVLVNGRGFSDEVFAFAEEHLRLRRRGVLSVWPVREVRADLAAMRREWAAQRQAPSE